jgi:hypothetical protein
VYVLAERGMRCTCMRPVGDLQQSVHTVLLVSVVPGLTLVMHHRALGHLHSRSEASARPESTMRLRCVVPRTTHLMHVLADPQTMLAGRAFDTRSRANAA